MTNVAIKRCSDYEQHQIDRQIKSLIDELGGIENFCKAGQTVVLKPNLITKIAVEKAATTHPSVVFAVANLCRSVGANVIVADSPGGLYNKSYLAGIYSMSGLRAKFENTDIKLNDNFDSSLVYYTYADKTRTFEIIDVLLKADVIINLCKLKTHSFTGFSGATKNLFGAIPGLVKVQMHGNHSDIEGFCDMLVDLCECLRPKTALHIMDAVVGMEGEGPTAGTPRKIGAILASTNPYSLDYRAISIIDPKPQNSPIIMSAKRKGVLDDKITVLGDKIDFISNYKLMTPDVDMLKKRYLILNSFTFNLISRRPKIQTSKCVGCKKCIEHCPKNAIFLKNNKARIDYKLCIKCFCCQELCPLHIIKVKRPFINKIISKSK